MIEIDAPPNAVDDQPAATNEATSGELRERLRQVLAEQRDPSSMSVDEVRYGRYDGLFIDEPDRP